MRDGTIVRPAYSHRPEAILPPDDPIAAAAFVLAYIDGEDTFDRAAAIEGLTARITKLLSGGTEQAVRELAAHLPILEALYHRFAINAMNANLPDHKGKLLRMALSAQSNYSRTLALIVGLRLQEQGQAKVTIENGEGDS